MHPINKDKYKSFPMSPVCRANIEIDEIENIYSNAQKKEFILDTKNFELPEMSVLLPLFRAKKIGWIALESLSRQKEINFLWELIIIEESFEDPMGVDGILKYLDRLKNVGCVRVLYVSLRDWIPLGSKWFFLIKETSKSSKWGAMTAADIYCSHARLRKQYDDLENSDKNWHHVGGNMALDLNLIDRHVWIKKEDKSTDTVMQTGSMEILRKLPLDNIKVNVDGWRKKTLNKGYMKPYHSDDDILTKFTVNIHGMNNLSKKRVYKWAKMDPCCEDLNYHLPKDICDKLRSSVSLLQDHQQIIEESSINAGKKKNTVPTTSRAKRKRRRRRK